MSTQDAQTIRDSVRDAYAARAKSSGGSCCGGGGGQVDETMLRRADHALQLYGSEPVNDLPVDVTGLSMGCGDPVTIAGLKPGETVLDLGSGGGIDCFMAARQVGETGQVIGVDMTPEMLEKANANKAKVGATNVEFRKGYIEDLPVDSSSVDVIMSNCVINLSPDKPAVFREAFRVLKPGGRISVSDIVTEGQFSDQLRADMSQWAGCIAGAIDIKDYTGAMRDAGLTDIEVKDKVNVGQEAAPASCCGGGSSASAPRIFSARITARKPV